MYHVELRIRIPAQDQKQGAETAKLLAALLTGLNIQPSTMEWNVALVNETTMGMVKGGDPAQN